MRQKQELQWALFPEGLTYSREKRFFESANVSLFKELEALYESLSNVGVPDRTTLNRWRVMRSRVYHV